MWNGLAGGAFARVGGKCPEVGHAVPVVETRGVRPEPREREAAREMMRRLEREEARELRREEGRELEREEWRETGVKGGVK